MEFTNIVTPVGRDILISIVSHGHGDCVRELLTDLSTSGNAELIRVVVTLNVPEEANYAQGTWPFPLHVVRNPRPRGFAENHNAAFRQGMPEHEARWFCVLNPDVRLSAVTMAALAKRFESVPAPAVVAPAVIGPGGQLEDSARPLPTPATLVGKAFRHISGFGTATLTSIADWDWMAGMFMLIDAQIFRTVNGFDEGYFLYYEDVDLCCRIRLRGGRLLYCPELRIVHDARRDSHRRMGHFLHHVKSAVRFFTSPVYRQCRRLKGSRSYDGA
jgi:GT2 family glycosyltransferase